MSAETKPAKQKDIRIKRHWYDNEGLAGYIFIGPWLLGFMLFMLIPILLSIYFAFAKYDLLSPPLNGPDFRISLICSQRTGFFIRL